MLPEQASSDAVAGLELNELLAMRRVPKGMAKAPGIRPPVGARAGKWRARGLDLDSIAAYQAGDDVRTIDWRATARSRKLQVRRFHADAHIAQILIVDQRPELLFATRLRPMAKTLALAAALLGWQALRFNEPLGMIILPNGPHLPPRRGRAWLLKLFAELIDNYRLLATASDTARIPHEQIETSLAMLAPGDGLVWLSDFAGTGSLPKATITHLGRHFDALAVIVEDAMTRAPIPGGRYTFHQAHEPPASIVVDRSRAKLIKREAANRRQRIRIDFLDAGWRLIGADDLIVANG